VERIELRREQDFSEVFETTFSLIRRHWRVYFNGLLLWGVPAMFISFGGVGQWGSTNCCSTI
jgi:hypothetical protein